MFRASRTRMIVGILATIAMMAHRLVLGSESESSSVQNRQRDSIRSSQAEESSVNNKLGYSLFNVDSVFMGLDGTSNRGKKTQVTSQERFRSRSLIQQLNYDIPPAPTDPDFEGGHSEPCDPPMILETEPIAPVPTPIPSDLTPIPYESYAPVFTSEKQRCCHDISNWSPIAQWFGIGSHNDTSTCSDLGIGHERVVFAPFEIDVSQPNNYMLVRWDSGFGLRTPDRGEFFLSSPGRGPTFIPPTNSINFQDLRFINETGNDVFSVQTEIPVRFLEPNSGDSTSGMGDMRVATKARLINGKRWQLTQIFRTFINTGSSAKGVGTGHVSLEPGLLARYEIQPDTFLHSQVKFLIPIAADPGFSSNVLTTGIGVSHVLYETNNFAIIPDLEFVNYNFLTGQKTYNGYSVGSGGENAFNIVKGVRFVIGPKGDLGLFEFGISNTIGVGANRYVNDLLRLDFKFIY